LFRDILVKIKSSKKEFLPINKSISTRILAPFIQKKNIHFRTKLDVIKDPNDEDIVVFSPDKNT